MQIRPPFTVENQHAYNRCERQNSVKSRGISFDHIIRIGIHGIHLSTGIAFIQITLPEEVRDRHCHRLLFSSTDDFKAREIIKLYSRRMQIEQNFRDEKSERFGFGLRASKSSSTGRMLVLSLLATLTTLTTIVMWLLGYHAENKGLHLRYQANSIKSRRVISYLTLAENVLRHSPLILRRTVLSAVLNHLIKTYRNMVLVY